jgi:hypothetical protein
MFELVATLGTVMSILAAVGYFTDRIPWRDVLQSQRMSIALVGCPGSGKTLYAAVLWHQLQHILDADIIFELVQSEHKEFFIHELDLSSRHQYDTWTCLYDGPISFSGKLSRWKGGARQTMPFEFHLIDGPGGLVDDPEHIKRMDDLRRKVKRKKGDRPRFSTKLNRRRGRNWGRTTSVSRAGVSGRAT